MRCKACDAVLRAEEMTNPDYDDLCFRCRYASLADDGYTSDHRYLHEEECFLDSINSGLILTNPKNYGTI